MEKSALIFGISGQSGGLLADLLLKKNYRVVGFGQRESILRSDPLRRFGDAVEFRFGDIRNQDSIYQVLTELRVSEIYNLAAQSQPGASWRMPVETGEINAIGAVRVFDAAYRLRPEARIFQASSADMFGDASETPQRETTPFNPVNPYAVAKVYAHRMAELYRQTRESHIACGILFNHESRYRGMSFVSQKLTYGAACAKLGVRTSPQTNELGEPLVKDGKLAVGDMSAKRDWGYAGDYVQAMWLTLQQPKADDFVIGTGVARSVQEMCETAYAIAGLDWRDHVVSDPRFLRPAETLATVADAAKARATLGWAPVTSFKDMLADMVEAHLERLRKS